MMRQAIIDRLYELETTRDALDRTKEYLASHVRTILQPNEKVLICFPNDGPASVGGLMERVVRASGGVPIFWGPDFRWKTLLRQAFDTHASSIIAPPLVVLGLMKMTKATSTPLYIHNAILGGYPYASWMLEGIKRGLDCRVWGSYMIDGGPVIAGFTCTKEAGIHIREDIFEASIHDQDGTVMEDAQRGYLTMRYKPWPDLVFDAQETAKIWHQPCSCGCDDPRIVETVYVGRDDPAKLMLEDRFLAWSSVLDYRVEQTDSGLALELVVFPGKKLPKIPTCASLQVSVWDPGKDVPFCMEKYTKIAEKAVEGH